MAKQSYSLEDMLTLGIDTKNRRIYFGGLSDSEINEENFGNEIHWSSVERAIRAIHFFENKSSTQPIEIHITSPGGAMYDSLRLIDTILASPCQIKFFGSGEIASAAVYIMAVCDERWLSPNSCILVHDSPSGGYSSTPNKLSDAYIDVAEARRLQDVCDNILANNTRMPLNFWTEISKRDAYLTAEEAILLGLADKIIEPKKRGTLRKTRLANLNAQIDKKELSRLIKSLYKRTQKGTLSHVELVVPNEQFDERLVVEAVSAADDENKEPN